MREVATANKDGVSAGVHSTHVPGVRLNHQPVEASQDDLWKTPAASPEVSAHQLHIWKIDLSHNFAKTDAVLSEAELKRGARYHFERDRIHFTVARSALRTILGRYLNLPPASLQFSETEYGKPFLINPEAAGVHFNLSHSKDVALLAVTRGREVGVDVEFMRADFATREVAEHFFSIAEIYTLSGLSQTDRTRAFFNCWTRKEAYVKARGEGLSVPLDQFDVSLAPAVPAALLGNRIDPAEMSRWILRDVPVAPDYAGAVCVEADREDLELLRFRFSS